MTKWIEYEYDAFNRMVRRTVDPDGPGGASATDQFFAGYVGIHATLEFDDDGPSDVSHRYLWGDGFDMLLADEQVSSVGSAGNVLWPLADHLGTIRDIADFNEGDPDFAITNHRVYDSFGRLESETNSAVDLAFGFTGKYTDADTGYTQHLFRWYDPATGRWLSEDPLGFAAGDANLTRYVGNDSVRSIDPLGLFAAGTGFDGPQSDNPAIQDEQQKNSEVENIKNFIFNEWSKEPDQSLDDILDRPRAWSNGVHSAREWIESTPEWKAYINGLRLEGDQQLRRSQGPSIGPVTPSVRDRARNQVLSEEEQQRYDEMRSYLDWETNKKARGLAQGEIDALDRKIDYAERLLRMLEVPPGASRWFYPGHPFNLDNLIILGGGVSGAPRIPPLSNAGPSRPVRILPPGTRDTLPTLDRIDRGIAHPHKNDGAVFENRPNPVTGKPDLPVRPRGYYREYVHPTPGLAGPGRERIVIGAGGEMYLTRDHYRNFLGLN